MEKDRTRIQVFLFLILLFVSFLILLRHYHTPLGSCCISILNETDVAGELTSGTHF